MVTSLWVGPTYFLISITVPVSFLTNDFFLKISNFQLKEKKKTPALYYEAPSVLFPNSNKHINETLCPISIQLSLTKFKFQKLLVKLKCKKKNHPAPAQSDRYFQLRLRFHTNHFLFSLPLLIQTQNKKIKNK